MSVFLNPFAHTLGGGQGQGPLLKDTFTDTNGTSLDAHTMNVGSGWTEAAQDWEIQSNEAIYSGGSDGQAVAVADAGQADAKVTHSITLNDAEPGDGRDLGMVGRYTDISNFWLVAINPYANEIRVYELNSGSFTLRASASVTLAIDTTYELVAEFDGTTVKGTVEGVTATYASATFNQSATKFGMRGFRDVGVILSGHDDWEVTPL